MGLGFAGGVAHGTFVGQAMLTGEVSLTDRWGVSLWTGGARGGDGSLGLLDTTLGVPVVVAGRDL